MRRCQISNINIGLTLINAIVFYLGICRQIALVSILMMLQNFLSVVGK